MRSPLRALAGAVVALGTVLVASPASAQIVGTMPTAPGRSGFSASLGLGVASAGLSCSSGCDDLERATGPAANVTLGYALNPRLRLGVDFTGWSDDMGWAKKTVQSYSLFAQLYPSASRNGWLRLSAGHAKLSVQEIGALEQSGTALSLASGWDFRLRDRVAFSPYALYLHQLPSESTGSGSYEGKGRVNMFQIGVGVTYGR
jgi:hypothetical protein